MAVVLSVTVFHAGTAPCDSAETCMNLLLTQLPMH